MHNHCAAAYINSQPVFGQKHILPSMLMVELNLLTYLLFMVCLCMTFFARFFSNFALLCEQWHFASFVRSTLLDK